MIPNRRFEPRAFGWNRCISGAGAWADWLSAARFLPVVQAGVSCFMTRLCESADRTREGFIGRSRRAVRVTIARSSIQDVGPSTFGFGVGNDQLGFSLLLAAVVRPVAVLGVLAVSTDPSGEPGQHQSPLIVGPVGVSYPTGRTIIVRPVRVTRNDILQKQPQNKDPARNMTESCHVLAHVHMHMHGMHAAACVRSRTAIAASQIPHSCLPHSFVAATPSSPRRRLAPLRLYAAEDLAAPPRARDGPSAPACALSVAPLLLARSPRAAPLACSHRRSSCRRSRRPAFSTGRPLASSD